MNRQIDQFGGDTASVVLVLTDGHLSDPLDSDIQVLFTVAVSKCS